MIFVAKACVRFEDVVANDKMLCEELNKPERVISNVGGLT
jgi:hypothetical protein